MSQSFSVSPYIILIMLKEVASILLLLAAQAISLRLSKVYPNQILSNFQINAVLES